MKIPYLQASSFPFSIPGNQLTKGVFLFGSIALSQWLITDLIHVPAGGLGIVACGLGVWWFFKPLSARFDAPQTVQGWINRCQLVLQQFEDLEEQDINTAGQKARVSNLNKIIDRNGPQSIAVVSSSGVVLPDKELVQAAISGPNPLKLSWTSSLPLKDNSWLWPQTLFEQDLLVYVLPIPLRASDLLWLEKVPEDQQSWVMVAYQDSSISNWTEQLKALNAQLPQRWSNRILRWSNSDKDLYKLLNPVRRVLEKPRYNLDQTRQRLLARLHSSWQSDLEQLRRKKFRSIQQKTQWVVAGAVFASPVPSTDLLALSVANGLMIKEMAEIWSCSWKPETLKVIAKQLATAAVAQGVVEWSGHALLSAAKLHGGGWIAAGTVQALSGAYLTRVVGRSMADWMALNNGVAEPDLEVLKKQASKLVAHAAEQERLDWGGFIKQASNWMMERNSKTKIETTFVEAI